MARLGGEGDDLELVAAPERRGEAHRLLDDLLRLRAVAQPEAGSGQPGERGGEPRREAMRLLEPALRVVKAELRSAESPST